VHQNWKTPTRGSWRQDPAISGGGFLFDTGSHMVNTVIDLVGEDVAEVGALLDRRGTPVEIVSAVNGRFVNGTYFSLTAAGDSIQCQSHIAVFGSEAVLRTGIWGEVLEIKRLADKAFSPVPLRRSSGVWEQFLRVRRGTLANPCPPEVGLRFARVMDMINASAQSGRVVRRRG
jgi:predicted dehydrogenase